MMQKLMQAFRTKSILLPSLSQSHRTTPIKSFISWMASYNTSSRNKAILPKPNMENSILADYLVTSLRFSKDKALWVSRKFSHCRTLERPEQVVHYFRGLGFSEAHIRSIAYSVPPVLFADIKKTLEPKVKFFQELGLSGSGTPLGSLFSKTPVILYCSLERRIKPRVSLIREVIRNDGRDRSIENVNIDLFHILTRCGRILLTKDSLEANIIYLKSCGIVGSQLSSLLSRLPSIFILQKDKLEEIVSRALELNFTKSSRMLVHGIYTLSCMSIETLNDKYKVFQGFGFSKEEIDSIFRTYPYVFGLSAATLQRKLELLLNDLKLDRLAFVQRGMILSMSIEERVIPRYKVLEILKAKGLRKKDASLMSTLTVPESQFLDRYVLRFEKDAQELLLAYHDRSLNTSTK